MNAKMGDRAGLTRLDRTNGYDDGRGYMKAKKSKLAQQNEQIREALRNRHNPMRTELFKGISINVNGRTQPTADELKRLILLNGGDYHPYYRYQTTKFMIATNLSMARVKTLRPDDKIVKPEWITDSIKAKCVLPYQDYQLFEESNSRDLHMQITDGNSNSSDHFQIKSNTASGSTTSVARHSNAPSKSTKRQNNEVDTKGQTTLEKFVIRGATRPKVTDVKQAQVSTSKASNGLPKANDIKSCFQQQHLKQQAHNEKVLSDICCLKNIDDVIGLLNEWVGCRRGIGDKDAACVTKYFYDLMNKNNFHDKFYEIIYAFQQRIVQHDDRCWIDFYNGLIETLKNELEQQGTESSHSLSGLIPMIETTSKSSESNQELHQQEQQQSRIKPPRQLSCFDVDDSNIQIINIDFDDDED